MNSISRLGARTLGALAVALALAATAHADAQTDKLKATLQQRLGSDAPIQSVSKSPLPGVYEVNFGNQIIYSDANGDYILVGDLVDTKTRTNVTQTRLAEQNKVAFDTLPLGDAIKVVKGNGSRRIAVFTDPNCPYCKRFEESLKSVDNITVYTFLYPVLSDDSTKKSKAIWCASDRVAAWHDWMLKHNTPTGLGQCDTSVLDKNLALGQKLKIDGTPTIFLADGRRLPGALSADELEKQLASLH
jgi:thiol:disulfide interchange protein DsbC